MQRFGKDIPGPAVDPNLGAWRMYLDNSAALPSDGVAMPVRNHSTAWAPLVVHEDALQPELASMLWTAGSQSLSR